MLKELQVHVYYTISRTSGENSAVEVIRGYLSEFAIAETLVFRADFSDKSIFKRMKTAIKMFTRTTKLIRRYKEYAFAIFSIFLIQISLRYYHT
jgi:FMN-dependent NADH-azoreductase